jgi:REP element-mobilizing transposase RayT
MDRFWLLTWTTYGTWLPGDVRGSVASVRESVGSRIEHDEPQTPYEPSIPGLVEASRERMRGNAVYLNTAQAKTLITQFQTTAAYRQWQLAGAAVMGNHVHLVVGVNGDPQPDGLIRDFKSYGSRALNEQFGKPASGTWWTSGGSRRKLPNELAVTAALKYVREQVYPLALWFTEND